MSDALSGVVLAGLLSLVGWAGKKTIFDPMRETQLQLIKHVDECNKIPKSLILEKIENLDSKVDEMREEFRERFHKR